MSAPTPASPSSTAAAAASNAATLVSLLFPSTFAVHVNATRLVGEENKGYTLYVLLVKWSDDCVWTVERRFSEFETLREKLSELSSGLPSLPGKTLFRNLTADFVSSRRAALDEFIQHCRQLSFVLLSPHFQSFLQLSENVNVDFSVALPQEIKSIVDPQFGLTSFHYIEKELLMLTTCEEVHITRYIDKKFSNFRLPWEKKGIQVPVGAFNCWRVDGKGEWVRTCSLSFECAVTCLTLDTRRNHIYLGLDNGQIHVYKVESQWLEFSLHQTLESHTGRVTGVVYDIARDVVWSIARDKRMVLYDCKSDQQSWSELIDKAWLSALYLDELSGRVFVGTYGQVIHIFDVDARCHSVKKAITLSGHTGSVRCLSYHAPSRYLFSGAFDCLTGIWSIGASGETGRSRSVGWLRRGPPQKVKAVCYAQTVSQVVTGVENGYIAVWNASTGKMLYCFRAHTYGVVRLEWLDDNGVLLSGGQDGKIKFWKFPSLADVQSQMASITDLGVTSPKAKLRSPASQSSAASAASSTVNSPHSSKQELNATSVSSPQQQQQSHHPSHNESEAATVDTSAVEVLSSTPEQRATPQQAQLFADDEADIF